MANQARLRLSLDCPSKAANAEHSKLSETNWNLLTRIGFHLNLLTPGRWLGVSHYKNTEVGAESDRLPPPKEESLTFFWLVVLFGRCGLLSWHGPQGIVDVLGSENWHMNRGQIALSSYWNTQILTMRSERSPQGKRATADSGLSSGGGGWGTQL